MVSSGSRFFVRHQPVDTLQDTFFGKCHQLRKDLTSRSADVPLPRRFSRDIPDETVKALACCLVLTIFLSYGDIGCYCSFWHKHLQVHVLRCFSEYLTLSMTVGPWPTASLPWRLCDLSQAASPAWREHLLRREESLVCSWCCISVNRSTCHDGSLRSAGFVSVNMFMSHYFLRHSVRAERADRRGRDRHLHGQVFVPPEGA